MFLKDSTYAEHVLTQNSEGQNLHAKARKDQHPAL